VGFLTSLVTFPIAPVRGVAWIAERVGDVAAQESAGGEGLRRELAELQERYQVGEISEEDYAAAEDELLERLLAEITATEYEEDLDG
jgi:hypothetical protein